MNTITQSHNARVSANREKAVNTDVKSDSAIEFWKNAEFNRLGITAILLVIMSCIGGFAAASGIMDSWIKLAAVAFPATIALAMILAVAPMRTIFITVAIAIIMDVFVLFF